MSNYRTATIHFQRHRTSWITTLVVSFILLVTWFDHASSAASGTAVTNKKPINAAPKKVTPPKPASNGFSFFKNPFSSTPKAIDRTIQEKTAHAEQLWLESIALRKEMLKANNHETTKFPDDYIIPFNVWDYARPSYFCPWEIERVGSVGDGGKWMCGMTKYEEYSRQNPDRPLIVYSFGVNDDSSFEAALMNRTNAEIWGYDYTVDHWAKEIKPQDMHRAHFQKVGIAAETNAYRNPPFFSVQDLMRQNNHTYIDIMKMDIEGAEYEALLSLVRFVESARYSQGTQGNDMPTLPFGQLLLEMHITDGGGDMPKNIAQWLNFWEALERNGARQTYNEDNWIGDIRNGRPRYMEYTMLNGLDPKRNILLQ